jgi:hypothetical protein
MDWTVSAEAGTLTQTPTTALAIDVDPRRGVVGLGLRRRSGGDQELWGNVVVRRFADEDTGDWTAAVAWLQTPEARALLGRIAAGYRASMAWSGDWIAEWSPDARQALHALQEALLERL